MNRITLIDGRRVFPIFPCLYHRWLTITQKRIFIARRFYDMISQVWYGTCFVDVVSDSAMVMLEQRGTTQSVKATKDKPAITEIISVCRYKQSLLNFAYTHIIYYITSILVRCSRCFADYHEVFVFVIMLCWTITIECRHYSMNDTM